MAAKKSRMIKWSTHRDILANEINRHKEVVASISYDLNHAKEEAEENLIAYRKLKKKAEQEIEDLKARVIPEAIPMRLPCPACGEIHIDVGEFATRVHHTHACQACGMVWRPAIHPTVGVAFLPGFKNKEI